MSLRGKRLPQIVLVCASVSLLWLRPTSTSIATTPPCGSPEIIPFVAQRPGDPDAGYKALISNGWVGCGFPARYYDLALKVIPDRWLPKIATLDGRPPGQEDLPYFLNRFATKSGLEVLAPNCLICHAGRINGKLVVGLGNSDGQYQPFGHEIWTVARILRWGSWLDPFSAARRAEMAKVGTRTTAVAPFIQVPVIGSSPANNLAWALVSHHDPKTLAWTDKPGLPSPPVDAPPADVPAWWNMRKKHAMFTSGAGRGDHTGLMAINATLCVDSVEDFDAFYDYFDDVRAFVASITPPPHPEPTPDPIHAAQGREVFEQRCKGCHGTYGEDGSYPNLLVPTCMVGTDSALAEYHVVTSAPAATWLNSSVFTRGGAHYSPSLGYVAPPLDGIWATAPYLHNGSVPTLAALLESSKRPTYWRRSAEMPDYDPVAVGLKFESLDPQDKGKRKPDRTIVDTTIKGFGNSGHTVGDSLTTEQRNALLDYLKTL
jgi:mono/diheme cytochrome c family protein